MNEDFNQLITNLIVKSKVFVCYRPPNTKTIEVLIPETDDLNKENDWQTEGFIFAPFSNEHNITMFLPLIDCKTVSFKPKSQNLKARKTVTDDLTKAKIQHIELVSRSIDFIKAKKADKIVISRQEKRPINKANIPKIYQQLCLDYADAFVYLWHHPKTSLWMGATPERLVSINQKEFSTMALAGTQLYQPQVNWTAKEKAEQQFVTDYILEQLKPISKQLKTSDIYTKQAGPLAHLCTDINGILNDKSNINALVKHLHPTPAVCGTPQVSAYQFIKENEGYDRQFYTGYLGYYAPKKISELFVNLRCLSVTNNQAKLYLGGGITVNSNPIREWNETQEKATVLGKYLV